MSMKYRVQVFDLLLDAFGDYGYAEEKDDAVKMALSQQQPYRVQKKIEATAPHTWRTLMERKAPQR